MSEAFNLLFALSFRFPKQYGNLLPLIPLLFYAYTKKASIEEKHVIKGKELSAFTIYKLFLLVSVRYDRTTKKKIC